VIRQATTADAEALAEIYNHYIRNTVITFEEEAVTASEMQRRIEKVCASGYTWLIAQEHENIIGYAYSTKWHERAAYRHTVEVSVYLAPGVVARGWGTKLYEALFSELRKISIHTAIGGIALPNPASVAIHEKFGMEKVAHFKQVGYKFGQWIDVGYWQVQLTASLQND
jgi:L-amino acid N-acyltransferase YncA